MNRKGSYDYARKAMYFIVVLFMLTFIFLYMHTAIMKNNALKVGAAEAITGNMIVEEAIMSPRCFAHYDAEISRNYPGIIDEKRFSEGIKEGCLQYVQSPFSLALHPFGDPNTNSAMAVVKKGELNEQTEKTIRKVMIRIYSGEIVAGYLVAELNDYYVNDRQKKPMEPYSYIKEQAAQFGEYMADTVTL